MRLQGKAEAGQQLAKCSEHNGDAGKRSHNCPVVEVRQELTKRAGAVRLQNLPGLEEGAVNSQGEQGRPERVALTDAACAAEGRRSRAPLVPQVGRRAVDEVEVAH
jgi:hypothetical protein